MHKLRQVICFIKECLSNKLLPKSALFHLPKKCNSDTNVTVTIVSLLHFFDPIERLPFLPIYSKYLEILIENLVARDQFLTGQVLRTANSAFYKGLMKVSTIHDAVVRLGIKEVSNIITLVTHRRNFLSNDPFIRGIMAKLWQHSVGSAIGAQWLARKSNLNSLVHEALVAGLLHDVGKLFILTVVEDIRRSKKIAFQPSHELLNEVMNSLHAEHGYSLLKNWNLPDAYCEIARDHHSEEFDSGDILLLLVRMSNHACNKMGIGLCEDPSILLAATAEANRLGLSEVIIAELEIKLEDSQVLALTK